jgi:anti-anti-sigma factor
VNNCKALEITPVLCFFLPLIRPTFVRSLIMIIETKRTKRNLAIVYLSGELNTSSLQQFKSEIQELVGDGFQRIIVDCRELGFISSSGLVALIWARTAGGTIYLTHVSAMIGEVLNITKLSRLLKIEPTTRGLLEKFGKIRKHRPKSKSLIY